MPIKERGYRIIKNRPRCQRAEFIRQLIKPERTGLWLMRADDDG